MKLSLAMTALVLLASSCTPSAHPAPSPAASPTVFGPPAQCPPTATAAPDTRQAYGVGVEMWALLFPTESDLRAGRELKIVVRITGPADVSVGATGPGGRTLTPAWGPEWHGGSTFEHPGGEFGVGFTFPAAGCWTLRVSNTAGHGDLALRIGP
ncbi:hypothetical protein [Hamadaea tsunoensis]|uniref:hypothetical protein n=1 Tax=Hamadaea tsunoensis TaxID=53368 RepID=UPI0012F99D04|nr:hypothetical protein [Hamadaea tsunoensis]